MITWLTIFYLVLIGLAGGFVFVSFIIGEIFDFGADVADHIDQIGNGIFHATDSIGNLFESLSGGADADAVDTDVGGVDAADTGSADYDIDESQGPSPFSLRTISMFIVGFGAGGLIGKGFGMPDLLSLAPASGTGAVGWVLMWFFMKFLYASQGSTSVKETDYIGLVARVTITIPENGLGGVGITVKGGRKTMPASSKDGSSIPAQTEVAVCSIEGGTLIVEKT